GSSLDQILAAETERRDQGRIELAARDSMSDPHLAAEIAELRQDLTDAIAALPFKYRTAVVLRLVVGLDYVEAAQTLGIPLNTFKSNLLRGIRLLRDQLDHHLQAAP